MRDRIEITKELIPYTFEISLADEIFTITVNYNAYADMFTFSLEKDGETVCAGEPIITVYRCGKMFLYAVNIRRLKLYLLKKAGT
ncbi:MAG: hypothetical protein V8T22_07425 [Oscillospiraceae bacterium]